MTPDTGSGLVQGLSGALLVGLAGFLYLHGSYFQRFQHAAAGQPTKTSLAFAYGIGFLFLTSAALTALQWHEPQHLASLQHAWMQITPVKGLSATFIVAPAVGLLCGLVGNVAGLVRESDQPYLADKSHPMFTTHLQARMRLAALGKVAGTTDDRMLATLWRAMTLGKLVQVTLKGRKVYIGSPLASADPSVETRSLKLVPIASGYRDSESLAYVPTTDYRGLFDELTQNDFPFELDRQDLGILLSWSEMVSLTIYDPALEDFFGQQLVPGDAEVEAQPGQADGDGRRILMRTLLRGR